MNLINSAVGHRQNGFALVLALWILSLLTIMAGSFALNIRRESSVIESVKNGAEASALAETGITIAELMLLNPDVKKRWRGDGRIYQITDPDLLGAEDAEVRVRLISENGKIDINKADQKLLAGLFARSPITDEREQTKLVSAILDWRDEDNLLNIDGAEEKEYKEAGLKYRPRNKPFQTVGELQMVLGINPTIYEWLAPLVTVYSGQNGVNMMTATKEVLQVLPDIDVSLLDEYLKERAESIAKGLPPPPLPTSGGGQNSPQGQGSGEGQGETMSIISEAQLADGATAVISAVLSPGGDGADSEPFRILEWRRNAAVNDSLFAETFGASAVSDLLATQYDEPEH